MISTLKGLLSVPWSTFWRHLLFTEIFPAELRLSMAEKSDNSLLKDDYSLKTNKCQSATELSESLKTCVKNVLSHLADEQFVSIYKSCYKEFEKKDEVVRPALSGSSIEAKKYYSQFNDMIIRSTCKTIEETVSNMNNQLQELEELKLSQLHSQVYWRPPGKASEHIIPFEVISQMEKKKDLEGKLEREQEALNILKTRLIQKRCKAKELNEKLLSLIEEIKNIVTNKINDEQLQEV